tara:strand:- start:1503 stop:2681 length:1179 start_codon:yes stop_codon:yes gene_type:complete
MFQKLLNKISYFSNYLQFVKNIELNENQLNEFDINEESNQKTYMIKSVKYLVWRKIGLILLIPWLMLDFILTILSYQKNLDYYNANGTHNTSYTIINFRFPHKAEDFMNLYVILTCIIITIQLIYILLAIIYNYLWHITSKWVRYSFRLSIISIYLVFLNPIQNYLRFIDNKNSSQTELYSFSYILILGYLLKEIIPIVLGFIEGIFWSSFNLKYLYPKNRLAGYFLNLGILFYILTIGFIFLVLNQLFNNYFISVIILFSLASYIVPYLLHHKSIKLYFDDDDLELKDMMNESFMIKNICYFISIFLLILYCFIDEEAFMQNIYNFHMIDILHTIIKLFHRYIFFKIFLGDSLLNLILQDAKYNILYKDQIKEELKILRDTENQMYIRSFY